MRDSYEHNGAICITWYLNSPGVPGGNAWDTTHGTVSFILPGGANDRMYKKWLDKVAFLGYR
ncbi:hypothetical protein [Chitinophaga sp. RAB17]|uniref:hypothetical protein n=1 Tax=Chitinophaga sp. RAB17 TaxID=3233049 RepID=UPI003F8E30C9